MGLWFLSPTKMIIMTSNKDKSHTYPYSFDLEFCYTMLYEVYTIQ